RLRPRPALRARERPPRPRRDPPARRRAGCAGARPALAATGLRAPCASSDTRGAHRPRGPTGARERPRSDREGPAVGCRRELEARALARHQGSRPDPSVRRGGALVSVGVYGPYGGRYVPETLIPALDELTTIWNELRDDATFRQELAELQRTYA